MGVHSRGGDVLKLAVVMLGAVVLSLAVGCGTKTVTVTTTTTATVFATPGATTSDSASADGSSSVETASAGDTLTLTSDNNADATVDVTFLGTQRLPAEGDWHGPLYGAQLTVVNTGQTRFEGSASAGCVIVDTQDQSHEGSGYYQGSDGDRLSGQLGDVNIGPGDKRTGWVYFELKGRAPRLLQYMPVSEADGGFEVGEWSLK